jgi:myosin heavy subunit
LLQLGLLEEQVQDLERLLVGVLAIGNVDFEAEAAGIYIGQLLYTSYK